ALRQEKTDAPLLIPIHPELAKALAAAPRTNMTFLVTERGKPFTQAGFGNWFRERCNEGRGAAMLGAWSAQGPRDAACPCRMQHRPDQGNHRPQGAVRGREIYEGG